MAYNHAAIYANTILALSDMVKGEPSPEKPAAKPAAKAAPARAKQPGQAGKPGQPGKPGKPKAGKAKLI